MFASGVVTMITPVFKFGKFGNPDKRR